MRKISENLKIFFSVFIIFSMGIAPCAFADDRTDNLIRDDLDSARRECASNGFWDVLFFHIPRSIGFIRDPCGKLAAGTKGHALISSASGGEFLYVKEDVLSSIERQVFQDNPDIDEDKSYEIVIKSLKKSGYISYSLRDSQDIRPIVVVTEVSYIFLLKCDNKYSRKGRAAYIFRSAEFETENQYPEKRLSCQGM